jgi:transcriptional regulator with XRE-family HTH domain
MPISLKTLEFIKMINAEQIRAARALLDWSTADLAKQTGLTVNGINKIERGHVQAHKETTEKLQGIFENAGIEFLPGSGLKRQDRAVEIYEGPDRFDDFSSFLYDRLSRHGGDVCLSVSDEELLFKYRKDPMAHRERLKALCDKGIIKSFRILANKSKFAPLYATYKKQPGPALSPTAFYAFGDCLALISFVHNPPPYVVVLQSAPLAAAYRQAFEMAWAAAENPSPSRGENS